MPVPKRRHTKSKRNRRRSHIKLTIPTLNKCPKCAKPVLPHVACLSCGFYKGKEVIDVMKKLTKKERKAKEREMAEKEAEAKKDKPLTAEELSKN